MAPPMPSAGGTCMDEREIDMKRFLNKYPTFFVAMVFLIVTGENVMAGGLVDTSVERFLAADFTNSENITNPWWTLTAGHNFLYFAQDGEDCVWNLTEVLNATTSNFEGVYAGTNARIVLDRGWVDQGCAIRAQSCRLSWLPIRYPRNLPTTGMPRTAKGTSGTWEKTHLMGGFCWFLCRRM